MTSQCSYTFERRNQRSYKYDKIFDYVAKNRDFSLGRLELLYKSGYISRKTFKAYSVRGNYTEGKYTYYEHSGDGYLCYITGKMRELGILNYSASTKKWTIGSNFDKYYNLNK